MDKSAHFYAYVLRFLSNTPSNLERDRAYCIKRGDTPKPWMGTECQDAYRQLLPVLEWAAAPYNTVDDRDRARAVLEALQKCNDFCKSFGQKGYYGHREPLGDFLECVGELVNPKIDSGKPDDPLVDMNTYLEAPFPEVYTENYFDTRNFFTSYANRLRATISTLELPAELDDTYEKLDYALFLASDYDEDFYHLERAQSVRDILREVMEAFEAHDIWHVRRYLLPLQQYFQRMDEELFYQTLPDLGNAPR